MKGKTIAIDLAKSVFEVGISSRPGQLDQSRRLSRKKFLPYLAQQEPCRVLMEACGSAHYWARQIQEHGHEVRLLPPLAVRPYVGRNKTDRSDVKGLLEADRNTAIRPVPVKSLDQQQMTALHRVRSAWKSTRTDRINTVRGLLRELGYVMPLGAAGVVPRVRELIEDAETQIPPASREIFGELCQDIRELEGRVKNVERRIEALARENPMVERLRSIPGVGVLTATAMLACVGDIQRFDSGRRFAAYLGLTPREHSSGLQRRLGRISRQGDNYLRMLLVHGGRAVLWAAKSKPRPDRLYVWGRQVQDRRGYNKAAVAMANKLARIVWAVWKRIDVYRARTVGNESPEQEIRAVS
jgi:transposase